MRGAGPQAAQQPGNHLVLPVLGHEAELIPGRTPLEQQRVGLVLGLAWRQPTLSTSASPAGLCAGATHAHCPEGR